VTQTNDTKPEDFDAGLRTFGVQTTKFSSALHFAKCFSTFD